MPGTGTGRPLHRTGGLTAKHCSHSGMIKYFWLKQKHNIAVLGGNIVRFFI
jgi:hypothetical protein